MFTTFTGSSRRPRNVNLSGQRNTNPWANSTWGGPAPSGASKSVAQAQADREKRQREREELAAAKKLQRVWRGHRQRREAKVLRCQRWDHIYQNPASAPSHGDTVMSDGPDTCDPARAKEALPLLLALFNPAETDDQQRLDQWARDMVDMDSCQLGEYQWGKLAGLLVAALEKRSPSTSKNLVGILIRLAKQKPASLVPVASRYYTLVTRYSGKSTPDDVSGVSFSQVCIAEAITAPLAQEADAECKHQAYMAFAFSYLTSPDLVFLESNADQVVRGLDLQVLSKTIIDGFSRPNSLGRCSKNDLLWLLAHFIALNRAMQTAQGSVYLDALYQQLCVLTDDIRLRSVQQTTPVEQDAASDDEEKPDARDTGPLPSYVQQQLGFLVNEDGTTELLSRFTSTANSVARLSEDASLLAGYTLILLRCFPNQADDMKMRLFQGDVTTEDSNRLVSVPTVKYFWAASRCTGVFTAVAQAAQRTSIVPWLKPDAVQDREWRTILLFLELYNFLLRVTDDEDFLVDERRVLSTPSPAVKRIRSSGLDMQELKLLITFLKNLTFALYHNLKDIMPSTRRPAQLNSLLGIGSSSTSREEQDGVAETQSFAGILGLDALSLRSTAITALRSLYERDSRRPFLPQDFWLMTAKFDMDSFISAVVLEEEQRAYNEEQDDDMSDSDLDSFDGNHTVVGQRLSRAAQIERQRQLQRIHREQLLSQVGPKLEILRNMPFTIPFHIRVQIFRQFVNLDKMERRRGHVDADQWRLSMMNAAGFGVPHNRDVLGRHTARIKRGQLFLDAFQQFFPLGEGLKEPIQITFVDQFDQPEAGIDGGGVTKEFLTSITDEAFNPGEDGPRLFVANSQNLLYPNPTAFDELAEILKARKPEPSWDPKEWSMRMQERSHHYEFLGRVVGKCMYEGILVDIAFAPFFLLRWSAAGQSSNAGFRSSLNDLRDMDPELYKGLMELKNYPGDVSDFSLDFTIADQFKGPNGKVHTIVRPLRPVGADMPVTNKDRPLYLSYVAKHRLVVQPYRQTKAFLRGLGSIINPSWLSMFNQNELQRLVGGDSSEIDVDDLRRHTQYSGLYVIGDDGEEHETVKMFWEVMYGLQDSERREVLKYVTSTPRAPLLGFSQLSPRFSIRDGGDDEERLPSTSTCVNLLKLPRYKSAKTLRAKLLYAIQAGAGFDLS